MFTLARMLNLSHKSGDDTHAMHAMRTNPNANGKECVMAAPDMPAGDRLIKNSISLESPFERWATAHRYDVAPRRYCAI